jgi:hypothetical protein
MHSTHSAPGCVKYAFEFRARQLHVTLHTNFVRVTSESLHSNITADLHFALFSPNISRSISMLF